MSTDPVRRLVAGPGQYWNDELPVSRGQYQQLAALALSVMGEPLPANRAAASVLIARLHLTGRAAVRPERRGGGLAG